MKLGTKRRCHWCEQRIAWDGRGWRDGFSYECSRAPFRAHEPRSV